MPLGTKVELDEELQGILRTLVENCDEEDTELRKSQVQLWKKLEEYWKGLQMIFWSEQDQSWITPDSVRFNEVFSEEEAAQLGPIYDYVVDIYKAHGESIIAALAANIPTLRYRPDDADNEADRMTARTYSKIADLVYIHNKARLLFLRALYYLYNAGNVFSYRYVESDTKFGVFTIPRIEPQQKVTCPACGSVRESNELEPCQSCGVDVPPEITTERVQTGTTTLPKSRAKIDTFGPLHVKVSYYSKNQDACGYLMLKTDQNKALVKSIHQDIADKVEGERMDTQDRFSRSPYTYPHEATDEKMNLVTVEKTWLRPWMFWNVSDKDKRDDLLAKFPKGCQVTFIGKNRVFAEAYDENLDDRWEIGQSGISTYIHSAPLGKTLVGPQDMRNELVNLTMDTIDHGIPATYVDSETLDFDTYGRFESQPGCVYSAKARPGQRLADAFAQEPKSTMSKEHMLFFRQIDQDAQFASGDFPSIHGGPSEGKSRTLGEYAMSKQMALQRLTIVWEFVLDWWIRTVDGGVRLYADTIVQDQSFSRKENNDYVNVWIRKSEMDGKVGGVEPESNSAFPVSIVQKRDTLFRLIELNNPEINAALYTPTNAKLLKDSLALEDLDIPGEDQRVKQSREIQNLTRPDAEPTPDQSGGFIPSVMIDKDVDDHAVHIAVLKSFLVSTVGLDLKETNPAGYVNCTAHLRAHQMALMQQTSGAFERSAPGEAPDSGARTTEGE
jgi:hypothetical protein